MVCYTVVVTVPEDGTTTEELRFRAERRGEIMAAYREPGVNEDDWKLFRTRFSGWVESYIQTKVIDRYIAFLSSPGNAVDKFYSLEKKVKKDSYQDCLNMRMSRSAMKNNILSLLIDGVITPSDLDGFSDELREVMTTLHSDYNRLRKEKQEMQE